MKTDMQLKKDVIAELDRDPSVNAADIGVEVKEGIVTLSGDLDSHPEKLAAIRATHRVAGVRAVAVDIEIRNAESESRTDTDIAMAASDALRWDNVIPRDRVKVTVENGEVTLTGDLDSESQNSAVEHAVRSVVGVRGITNQILVNRKNNG